MSVWLVCFLGEMAHFVISLMKIYLILTSFIILEIAFARFGKIAMRAF
ncbi:hypothetical protein V473_10890 [Sphingobium cupriresistens LL01]|uniref:Uncharacterized protein n=1 Tax=Sphingobium cupriresistens LL01 TaxID=1420583 RepID=A0A0J7Y4R9_9SPHN|nr:hypothetical protein V473_10890 [Sphingobium cupriresistens LL01]